jgi:gliding motility-associated-like protein
MTLKNSAAINNRLFFNAGLEVDDCERIYVGVNKSVVTYDTAFTVLSTIVTPDTVFDLKLGPGNKLYASGIGFVSEFQLTTTPCNTMSISVSASGSCAASSATVTVTGGSAPYTYSWSPGGQTTSVATGLSSGTYTVTVSDATSLCVPGGNIQTATVSITSGALSASVTSTPASCLAGNGSATVTPTGGASPYTYAWSPSGGTNAIASGLAAGNYSVIITDASGCTGTSAVTISSAGGPVVSLSGQTNILCNGMNNGTASVAAGGGTSPYTYSWSPSGGNSSAATGLSAGAYTATVTDATGCSSTQTVTLTQPPAITSSISATPALCGSNNGTATVAAAGGAGTFTYSWSPGGQTSAAVTGLGAGVYSAIVTDGNGCTQTETVAVTSTGGPTAVVSANVTITSGSSATLTASGGGTYVWSNGSIDSVISVSPQVTTVYCVTVSNGLCTDTACVIVYIEPTDCGYSDDQLFVPDAFSPNNDTKNDVLGIYFPNLSCIKDFRFIVYDRWGEKVFESTNVTATWDGTYKGMTMNSAVFVYYMKVTFINGNETVRKGNVSLIR